MSIHTKILLTRIFAHCAVQYFVLSHISSGQNLEIRRRIIFYTFQIYALVICAIFYLHYVNFLLKIAGRKRPTLVDSSHKVRQGGEGTQPSPIQPQKTNPNF